MREYERRDAEATEEMQRAAHAVAWRNGRLVALLARHGVYQAEIDAFLQQEAGALNGPVPSAGLAMTSADPIAARLLRREGVPADRPEFAPSRSGPMANRCSDSGHDPRPSCVGLAVESADPTNPGTSRVRNSGTSYFNADLRLGGDPPNCRRDEDNKELCPLPDAVPLTTTKDETSNGPLVEVTSCDAAAGIIAELHGHGDAARARGLLGCDDSSNCHVKNTKLLQLMVETT